MFGQKNWLIITIKSHELEIFSHVTLQVSSIPLPINLVNNLEIIDRDGLYGQIAQWAKQFTYQATEIIWLLSPGVIFEDTFPDKERERWDTMTVQFLDAVPFEEVLSHVYSPLEGRNVVATNQDLINALRHGFAVQGYQTKAVIPASLVNATSPLTEATAKEIISNLSQILAGNMITPDDDHEDPLTVGLPQPKPKSQLPLLLGVFGVLLVILVFVVVLNQ